MLSILLIRRLRCYICWLLNWPQAVDPYDEQLGRAAGQFD